MSFFFRSTNIATPAIAPITTRMRSGNKKPMPNLLPVTTASSPVGSDCAKTSPSVSDGNVNINTLNMKILSKDMKSENLSGANITNGRNIWANDC